MIVALDAQLAVGTATGIGEYVSGLAPALRARGIEVVELRKEGLDPWRFDRRVWWDQALLPRLARASGAQLLHCASGTMPLRANLPMVVTVHDVAWLKTQRHARFYARYYFGGLMLARYARARAIAVDSHFSRSELLALLDGAANRVRVIYPGVSQQYSSLRREADSTPFVLVAGTVEPRKNLEVLVRALPSIDAGVKIVCAGPFTPYRSECAELAQALGMAHRLEFLGYVPRARLLQLYASCALVAVPSHYEGFGYAAAQALCAGAPVVVSDRSSLPEIVQSDAAIVPAGDSQAWAAAVNAIVRDPQSAAARSDAVRDSAAARFSWARAAESMALLYEQALR